MSHQLTLINYVQNEKISFKSSVHVIYYSVTDSEILFILNQSPLLISGTYIICSAIKQFMQNLGCESVKHVSKMSFKWAMKAVIIYSPLKVLKKTTLIFLLKNNVSVLLFYMVTQQLHVHCNNTSVSVSLKSMP